MKTLAIIVLIGLALSGNPAAITVAIFAAIFWLLKKIRLLSAPRRMSNAAGNAVRRGYNRWSLTNSIQRMLGL